jgi:hypothetical protein
MAGEFDEVRQLVRRTAASALDKFADNVHSVSEPEVPVKFGELKASALYPANDPASRCDPELLEDGSMVSYNTVYAAAQHEAEAVQHRMHPSVPIVKSGLIVGWYTDTSRIYEHDVNWVVEHYTEPGTKGHYLSDPLKYETPKLERFMALNIAQVLK